MGRFPGCFEALKMEEVHPSVCSQNGDALQVCAQDGAEFQVVPVPMNEEELCFWSVSCVLCCTELLRCEEKKPYLCERLRACTDLSTRESEEQRQGSQEKNGKICLMRLLGL